MRKNLVVDTMYSIDLANAIGIEELEEAALKSPRIRRLFKEHLKECGIEPVINEATIEAGFFDFLEYMLEDSDVKISISF